MKNLFIIGGIVLIAGLGLYAYVQLGKPSSTVTPAGNPVVTNTNANVSTNTNTAGTTNGYTLAQISSHASAQNCWLLIDNKVYNVTSFINQHPGGSQMITVLGDESLRCFLTTPIGVVKKQRKLSSPKTVTADTLVAHSRCWAAISSAISRARVVII